MATQPKLDESLDFFDTVKFNIVHRSVYCDLELYRFDQPHIHSCYEIYVHIGGDVSFYHNQKIYDITAGDIVFSKPGDAHYCIYNASCLHDHYCIWFDDIGGNLTKYCSRIGIPSVIRLSEQNKVYLLQILGLLINETTDPLLKLSKLIEMLMLCKTGETISHELREEHPKVISDILTYIDTHYSEIRTIADIADVFFISQSTINRLFRKYIGQTVSRIIETKRLSQAEYLLRGGASVTDACFSSGFKDCSRFISLFKKTFGMTPLQYKQKLYKK